MLVSAWEQAGQDREDMYACSVIPDGIERTDMPLIQTFSDGTSVRDATRPAVPLNKVSSPARGRLTAWLEDEAR